MKQGFFYAIAFHLTVILLLLIYGGCLRPVGKCKYGEIPAETGTVKIKSIERVEADGKTLVKVRVDGFFRKDFVYEEQKFDECFRKAGYTTGSELKGTIVPGGPCPPMYRVNACD